MMLYVTMKALQVCGFCIPAWEVVLGVFSLNAVCVDGVRNEEVETDVEIWTWI